MLRTLDPTELAWALVCLGDIDAATGHIDNSQRVCEEAAQRARGLGMR
jgi:hypothetical protein